MSQHKLEGDAKSNMSLPYPEYPKVDYGVGKHATIVKRGEYLAKMGDCISCHTDSQHGGAAFAGGLPIKTPFGTFYSPNITMDKKTGIGQWSSKNFYNALHHGKKPDGSNYFPVFPYLYYNKISQQDVQAIWTYLQAVPAVEKKNRAADVPFPFNVRFAQYFWKAMYFYSDNDGFKYNPNRSREWNRGAYVVNGLGHCGMCHTPMTFLGGPKRSQFLTGAFIDGFWAPNITEAGLQSASKQNIVDVFRQDELINDAGQIAGPMREVNHESLQQLTDQDLAAIATYLKTVKSQQPLGLKASHHKPALSRGKQVYRRACILCHQQGVAGAPRIGDSANWGGRVKSNGIFKLYRHAVNGFNAMPAKGGCVTCSDEDIESAVDYLVQKSLSEAQLEMLAQPKAIKRASLQDGKEIYNSHCAACHQKGALGAPITGDKKAWAPLIRKNMDVLIGTTIKGNAKMPAKGGCKYCSNSEVIAAVKYMVQQSRTHGDYQLW
jgi:cytochrome c5